jgi:hypothetical protein
MDSEISKLKIEIEKAITKSTTKLISPLLMLFYLQHVEKTKNPLVENSVVREGYEETVCNFIKNYLHYNFNIGGTFNNTYISRLSYRHRFLRQVSQKTFEVQEDYFANANELIDYTKMKIAEHLNLKLGNLVNLKRLIEPSHGDIKSIDDKRKYLEEVLQDTSSKRFREFLETGFDEKAEGLLTMSYGFEICMFSILKIFLAKFGCRLYRDSRTYAVDKGGDISTNFGVVYQIKNYCLTNEEKFMELLNELFLNFSDGRIQQGNVFLIIRDASDGVMAQLKNQRINCITKSGVTDLLDKLTYAEKHEVLVSIVREFNRELLSDVCRTCRKVERAGCPYSVGVIEFEKPKNRSSLGNLNNFLDK